MLTFHLLFRTTHKCFSIQESRYHQLYRQTATYNVSRTCQDQPCQNYFLSWTGIFHYKLGKCCSMQDTFLLQLITVVMGCMGKLFYDNICQIYNEIWNIDICKILNSMKLFRRKCVWENATKFYVFSNKFSAYIRLNGCIDVSQYRSVKLPSVVHCHHELFKETKPLDRRPTL